VHESATSFVADTSSISAQVIPRQIKSLVQPLLKILGRPPGILAPRVAEATVQLALYMGMPNAAMPSIRQGALLHDIGKMAVPDSLLLKPGPLNEAEWRLSLDSWSNSLT
jgi:HD-GYP domain-containing protein (c-di-GMP phosphodiesterase class II)